MKSMFHHSDQQDLYARLQLLDANSTPKWGKMDVAQMCAHCSKVLAVYAGIIEEGNPPFIMKLFRPMIKNIVFGQKPYKKNSATAPGFKITDQKDFEKEYTRLIDTFNYFIAPENKSAILGRKSKVFGPLTEEEIGWSQYKHLDHHLTQFGV